MDSKPGSIMAKPGSFFAKLNYGAGAATGMWIFLIALAGNLVMWGGDDVRRMTYTAAAVAGLVLAAVCGTTRPLRAVIGAVSVVLVGAFMPQVAPVALTIVWVHCAMPDLRRRTVLLAVGVVVQLAAVTGYAGLLAELMAEPVHAWLGVSLFGRSASGFGLLLLAAAPILADLRRSPKAAGGALLVLVGTWSLFVWHLGRLAAVNAAATVIFAEHFWMLLTLSTLSGLVVVWMERARGGAAAEPEWSRRRWRVAPSVALALTVVTLPLLLWMATPRSTGTVLFHNEGGLDWERPRVETPNGPASGMFGMLPIYLESDGFRVRAERHAPLEPAALDGVDVFVVINCPHVWSEAEQEVLADFARRGGSILVLGDHTDVFGLQQGSNAITEPFGARFRFDSAYYAGSGWRGASFPLVHPATGRTGRYEAGHGIGASLEIGFPMEPLLEAPFAFSDHGIRENVGGAFLGNYTFSGNEELGDMTLAAWRAVGSGRLVVYGDTSAFQNSALSATYRGHVKPLFEWMCSSSSVAESSLYRVALLLLALLSVVLAVAGATLVPHVLAPVVLCQLAVGTVIGAVTAPVPDLSDGVLIDYQHMPLVGHYEAKMNSIGPLMTNILRTNLLPICSYDLKRDLEHSPRAVVLVAPGSPLGDDTVEALDRYMRGGGRLVLATGFETRGSVTGLLRRLGVDISQKPIGRAPPNHVSRPEDLEPRTRHGWAIVAAGEALPPGAQNLFAWQGDSLAIWVPRGDGGCVLIGDGSFFSSSNVESINSVWPGNVRFLANVLRKFVGGTPDEVAARFESPEKP